MSFFLRRAPFLRRELEGRLAIADFFGGGGQTGEEGGERAGEAGIVVLGLIFLRDVGCCPRRFGY